MSRILVINPGSKSTKIAMYEDSVQLWQQDIEHDAEVINSYPTIYSQLEFRADTVIESVKQHGDRLEDLACIMSRGGLLPPLSSGAYEVNEEMLDVLEHRPINHHASNLGAAIAYRLAVPLGIKAYIYDPVTVDEMIDIARITGLKEIRRHGQGHNLNMRAAALRYCRENGLNYKGSNLIVAHLGGGITLTLHSNGRIIDMVSDDEGPFSSERVGLIPGYKLVKFAYMDGRRYHHIVDPRTGYPAQTGLVSVTLVGEKGAALDALATAALILGPEKSMPLLSAEGMDAVFVTDQGQVLVTKGLKNKFRLLNKTNAAGHARSAA